MLNVVGHAYDDGASAADIAARIAAEKKKAEEEKMREWQAQRSAAKGGA